jgi:hypothetical protein
MLISGGNGAPRSTPESVRLLDAIAISVSHGLLLVAFWRLLRRDDLDDEAAPEQRHRAAGFGAATRPSD